MTHAKRETVEVAYNLANELGRDEAARQLNISRPTLARYITKYKVFNDIKTEDFDDNLSRQLRDRFSDEELRGILKGSLIKDSDDTKLVHDFGGDTVTFGAITDTHLGSKYTDTRMLMEAFDVFAESDVDFITHCGDVHEGLSHRAGHVYECTHVGYSAQLEHSRDIFSNWTDTPIYMIDGNHDQWAIKSAGAKMVPELCMGQENLHFLGHDEGDVDIDGVTIKLWHGGDGSSYAFSYRVQKIVESFTGGEKPNVLLCGHTHKAFSIFDRNIHCVSCGSMQKQSKWMRGKRAASHTGFYVVRMGISNGQVSWFEPRFYPFYQ